MRVYTSLFISLCFNACVSLYSLVSLILLNRVAWLVLLFELSLCNGNGFGLSARVKISTHIIPSAVLLSVRNGIGGCGGSNSSNIVLSGDNSSVFIYNLPTSASAADPITPLIIFASTYIGPLNCVPSLLPK